MNQKNEPGNTQARPADREETERNKAYREAVLRELSRPNTVPCPHCAHALEIK